MLNLKITSLGKVNTSDADDIAQGVIAFELIKVEYSFYGNAQADVLDTKILKDGRRIVIDGNGYIKSGTEI